MELHKYISTTLITPRKFEIIARFPDGFEKPPYGSSGTYSTLESAIRVLTHHLKLKGSGECSYYIRETSVLSYHVYPKSLLPKEV